MLKIQFKDRRKPAIWLVESTFVVGSDPGCDIRVDEDGVSPQHAELVVQQEEILLRNVSQNRSVFINDVPVVKEEKLQAWDIIRLGQSELEIIDPLNERTPQPNNQRPEQKTVIRAAVSPWMLKAVSAPLDGQYFSITNGAILGREKDSDIIVPLSYVSRQHAKFALRNDKLYIDDLNSSNGTYVNGEKIKSCELLNGDELRLDEFIFNLVGPETDQKGSPRTIVRAKTLDKGKQKKAKPATKAEPSGDASHKVFMHGLSTGVQGKVYEITQVKTHLSRMLGHHLSTSEQSVSARHVYLTETDLGWEVINNGASDGLLVNGKMQSKAILEDGDELIVGGTLLKFQSLGDKPLSFAKPTKVGSGSGKIIIALVLTAAIVAGLVFSGVI